MQGKAYYLIDIYSTMPLDKNKTRRFQVLDRCFADQKKMYFWEDLQEACRKALADAGMQCADVSRRTILNDITEMEGNGDWKVDLLPPKQSTYRKRRFYRYADPNYSIWKIDLTEEQLTQLKSVLLMLRQFENFPQYDMVEDIVAQLEKKYKFSLGATNGVMAFEANDNIDAMQYIGVLFSAIVNKQTLKIVYQPFGKPQRTQIVHPYYLKQYNRRWFLFCYIKDNQPGCITNFALDRIVAIEPAVDKYIACTTDWNEYFEDLIGVTQTDEPTEKIVLRFAESRLPYIQSKPLHPSQRINKETGEVMIEVKPTKELYQCLLSFGADVQVISPQSVREKLKEEIDKMRTLY